MALKVNWTLLYVMFACILKEIFCGNLEHDLKILSKLLPGIYSTSRQSRNALPDDGTSVSLQAIYRPVKVDFLPDAFNVYVEQRFGRSKVPSKQWLYSFVPDPSSRAIRLKLYTFLNPSIQGKVRTNPHYFRYLKVSDVTSRTNCDMFWRRLGSTFVGVTSKDCIANFKSKKVRISVSATLTSTTLQLNEGWYNVQDGDSIVELKQPIKLRKNQKIRGHRYRPRRNGKTTKTPTRSRRHGNYRSAIPPFHPQQGPPKHPRNIDQNLLTETDTRAALAKALKLDSKFGSWPLRTYTTVTEALMTGHDLHYLADISGCDVYGDVIRETFTFGGQVNVYEIERDNQDRGQHHLTFSQTNLRQSNFGLHEEVRQITLYSNSSVIVDIFRIDPEHNRLYSRSTAYCRLYDDDNRVGDVRFTLNPFQKVRKIKSFGSLRSSLKKGKSVRINADLSKCGGGVVSNTFIGGVLKEFDITKFGKQIEATLLQTSIENRSEPSSEISKQVVSVKLANDHRAILTVQSRSSRQTDKNHSIVKGFLRYRCQFGKVSSVRALHIFS